MQMQSFQLKISLTNYCIPFGITKSVSKEQSISAPSHVLIPSLQIIFLFICLMKC